MGAHSEWRGLLQGERVRQDVHVDMVNVQNPDVKVVGVRTAASEWELSAPVIWPGGGTEVPSDRSLPDVGTVVRTQP